MKLSKSHGLIVLLVGAVAVGGWRWLAAQQSDQQRSGGYRLVELQQGDLLREVASVGTLSATTLVEVGSQLSGQLSEVHADFNDEVDEGALLARIDPSTFSARVEQTRADLAIAKANLTQAEANVTEAEVALADARRAEQRLRRLQSKGSVSDSELDTASARTAQEQARLKSALAQIETAKANIVQREAQLNSAEVDLERTYIRSPVDGVVISRDVTPGQTVAASLQAPVLFTIAQDLRHMQLEVSVDEADIGQVRQGQAVVFNVDAYPQEEFQGTIQQVRKAPVISQNVVTYTVIVETQNPSLKLLPGMTANVQIIVGKRSDVLKIPNAALRFRSDVSTQAVAEGGARRGGGQGNPQQRLEQMTERLGLNQTQVEQVQQLYADMRPRMRGIFSSGLPQDQARAQMAAIREELSSDVRKLLDAEQQQIYDAEFSASRARVRGQVWILDENGELQSVRVVTGLSDGSHSELISGDLATGQQVVTGEQAGNLETAQTPRRRRFGF